MGCLACTCFDRTAPYPKVTTYTDWNILLSLGKFYNATDMRYKVFAVLGMATNANHPAFYVDYIQTPAQTFQRFAYRLLENHETISVLCKARSTETDVPSWIPAWASDDHSLGSESLGSHDAQRSACGREPKYRACRSTRPSIKMVAWLDLHISGVLFDRVGEVGFDAVWGSDPFTASGFRDFVRWEDEARHLREVFVAKAKSLCKLGYQQ
jgi:hypothetical protein